MHNLKYWITQFNKEQSNENVEQQWISFPLKESGIPHSSIILKAGNISIEVSAGFDKNVLIDVLSAVQSYDRYNKL